MKDENDYTAGSFLILRPSSFKSVAITGLPRSRGTKPGKTSWSRTPLTQTLARKIVD
jgi:hypothetical protein